jgi:predicted nucleic acid-binding protein
MTRYVIGADVALRLSGREVAPDPGHRLLAPTLLRPQLLAQLYRAVRSGAMTRADAERHLDYVRKLRLRLLGDRVLQAVAWRIADELGWEDTLTAEYLALTRLQADAFATLDEELARAASRAVPVATLDALV